MYAYTSMSNLRRQKGCLVPFVHWKEQRCSFWFKVLHIDIRNNSIGMFTSIDTWHTCYTFHSTGSHGF